MQEESLIWLNVCRRMFAWLKFHGDSDQCRSLQQSFTRAQWRFCFIDSLWFKKSCQLVLWCGGRAVSLLKAFHYNYLVLSNQHGEPWRKRCRIPSHEASDLAPYYFQLRLPFSREKCLLKTWMADGHHVWSRECLLVEISWVNLLNTGLLIPLLVLQAFFMNFSIW